MQKLYAVILIWLLFSPLSSIAQLDNYAFYRPSKVHFLSSGYVHNIFKDSRGYLWFGTQDGLACWDGRVFKPGINDPASISCALVKDIAEDFDGMLWVATIGGGVCRFNPETGRFQRFPFLSNDPKSLSDPNAVSLLLDSDKNLWIGTYNGGLNLFDREKQEFLKYPLATSLASEQEAFKRNSVHAILEDIANPGILWLATNDGIGRFEKATGKVSIFHSAAPLSAGMSTHSLYMKEPGVLWAGSYGGGVVRFSTTDYTWKYFPPKPNAWERRSAVDNIIFDIEPKSDEELWVCSPDLGFGIFNTKSGAYYFFKNNPDDPLSILSNEANTVFQDVHNALWVSHPGKGVSQLNLRKPAFQMFSMPSGDCRVYLKTEMFGFDYDPVSRRYFVAGNACDGFFMLDENKQLLRNVQALGYENQYMIYKTVKIDHRGKVWAGGLGSLGNQQSDFSRHPLWVYDPVKDKLIPFKPEALAGVKFNVIDIHEDLNKNLWLATDYQGLMRINENRNDVQFFYKSEKHPDAPNKNVRITKLLEAKNGMLWLATLGEGVYSFDPRTQQFKNWNHSENGKDLLLENRITSLAEDKNGNIWVGTSGNGIQFINQGDKADAVLHIGTINQSLPSSRIHNLLTDRAGNIWVTTENGLCRYDHHTNRIFTFNAQDGVINPYFHENGMKLLPTNELLIGTPGGFLLGNPDSIVKNVQQPKVVFTEFKIFEKVRHFDKDLNYLNEITLRHDENFFSIGFIALNYQRPEQSRYAYRLEGLNPDWIYPQDNRTFATFTSVPPGHYVFSVRNANSLLDSQEDWISIKIVILPPWWFTWWAISIWCLLFFAAVYGIYQFQLKRQMAEQESLRLRELDQVKTRLYAGITHEFKTPLTIILGYLQKLLHKPDKVTTAELETALGHIQNSSNRLLGLVNQILDLQKINAKQLQLHFEQADIVGMLRYLTGHFDAMATEKGVSLVFNAESAPFIMDVDQDKLTKIYSNLLSNAIKFTKAGGNVSVSTKVENIKGASMPGVKQFFSITVADTGAGIHKEDLNKIFELFYQSDNANSRRNEGTGIGLTLTKELVELLQGKIEVESEPDKGATFRVLLPVLHQGLADSNSVPAEAASNFSFPLNEIHVAAVFEHPVEKKLPLVLVIEDDREIAAYIGSCLSEDYRVKYAYDGKSGMEEALHQAPDIVVSDVMMPEANGFEVCQFLKNDTRTSHIPVVLLTAKSETSDRLEGLRRGADAYLSKPFYEEELQITLEKLLQLRQVLRVRYSHPDADEFDSEDRTEELAAKSGFDLKIEDAFMQRVHAIIHQNLNNPDFSVEMFCREIGMSHTQFFNKLKSLTGLSAVQLIRQVRIKEAKRMLKDKNLSVTDVAFQTGFSEAAYFSRIFSKETGMTPSEYKKSL